MSRSLHDIDAERTVLPDLLVAGQHFNTVEHMSGEMLFSSSRHRKIYRAIGRVVEEGKGMDVLAVKSQLEADGQLQSIGGKDYLAQLLDCPLPTSSAFVRSHAKVLASLAWRRNLAIRGRVELRGGKRLQVLGRTCGQIRDTIPVRIIPGITWASRFPATTHPHGEDGH